MEQAVEQGDADFIERNMARLENPIARLQDRAYELVELQDHGGGCGIGTSRRRKIVERIRLTAMSAQRRMLTVWLGIGPTDGRLTLPLGTVRLAW